MWKTATASLLLHMVLLIRLLKGPAVITIAAAASMLLLRLCVRQSRGLVDATS